MLRVSRKTDGAHLAFWDAKRHRRIDLGEVNRRATLAISDEKGQVRVAMISMPDEDIGGVMVRGGGFTLKDKDGKEVWTVPKD